MTLPRPYRVVVFDSLMFRAYAIDDAHAFPDELAAFQVSFRRRRFRILLTSAILSQYQSEANKAPQFQLLPVLNALEETGVTVFLDEYRIDRSTIELIGFRKWHQAFILDAIGAGAAYFITNRPIWLDLSEQTETRYSLGIVTPARFVELEG